MRVRRIFAVAAAALIAVFALAGCTSPQPDPESDVTIGTTERFSSYNTMTPTGAASGNGNVTAMTLSNFTSYDANLDVVEDTSFGTVEKISDEPLVVRYTISDDATWSDGTPVDAADLLLDWAANSRALDSEGVDVQEYRSALDDDPAAALPDGTVFFDSGARPDMGLGLARDVPQLGDDGRSMTVTYSQPITDWKIALPPPLPAHVVAKKALGEDDAESAKEAVVQAITSGDDKALSSIASFWNTGFSLKNVDDPSAVMLSSGPYVIDDVDPDSGITLTANPEYRGDHSPAIRRVQLDYHESPSQAVDALAAGDVDVISPQATPEVTEALSSVEGASVLTGFVASFEHIDLQFDGSSSAVFDDPRVREAFLKTIPRQKIVDELVTPIAGADAQVRNSFVFTPGMAGYDNADDAASAFADVDIEGAKRLLDQAKTESPEVCILYAANNPRRVTEFSLIAESAKKAGFAVTDCGTQNWRELLGVPGKYDAALFAWESTSTSIADSASRYVTDGRNNLNGYASSAIDDAYRQLATLEDAEKKTELLTRVDETLWSDFYGMPLYQFPSITAFNPDAVTGVDPIVLAPTLYWNVWKWHAP
ncbi:ABC transporter family substrate-binding protein [Paramicrobacterium agarici]|uniref:ABC transporter family substrate-binding protein n=1 Tax=Paramicrobacterium agarici TaxID=630514 RepID=UPI001153E46A|nr:ABC transporter family substrate-binding protein [Microbacterium agarici]TQO21588.1 peptide/nickel transport system substrate-binding protein [Microbacterium agarici]